MLMRNGYELETVASFAEAWIEIDSNYANTVKVFCRLLRGGVD